MYKSSFQAEFHPKQNEIGANIDCQFERETNRDVHPSLNRSLHIFSYLLYRCSFCHILNWRQNNNPIINERKLRSMLKSCFINDDD